MKQQDNRTVKRKLGDIGENIACDFLKKRGFEIIEKNYLRKWGEIDIVAKNKDMYHFVEVKSVSGNVTQETSKLGKGRVGDTYRPEDNMHPWKLKRLSRAIQTYLLDKNLDNDWQLDLITVKMDMRTRRAHVELVDNIII